MRKYTFVALAILLATPAIFAASATTANTDNITASVANNCRIDTFTLAFGPYDPVVTNAAANLDASVAVNVYCTKGGSATSISMGAGSTLGAPKNGTAATRTMTGYATVAPFAANGAFLDYEIYNNSGRTTVWNAANTIVPNASTSKNTPLTFGAGNAAITAYGRVFAGQDVPAGDYKDTVQATVNF